MRSIGGIALEHELQVGDVILSRIGNCIYTILRELPGIPSRGIVRVLIVHSTSKQLASKCGIFEHEVPRGRVPNYSFISDGIYTGWGW